MLHRGWEAPEGNLTSYTSSPCNQSRLLANFHIAFCCCRKSRPTTISVTSGETKHRKGYIWFPILIFKCTTPFVSISAPFAATSCLSCSQTVSAPTKFSGKTEKFAPVSKRPRYCLPCRVNFRYVALPVLWRGWFRVSGVRRCWSG